MKVLVTGGRAYGNRKRVYQCLFDLHRLYGITQVIHGAATGADTFAGEWAEAMGVPVDKCPVPKGDWDRLGNRAGNRRNTIMLQKGPDVVLAFQGHSGTVDMITKVKDAGILLLKTWETDYLEPIRTPSGDFMTIDRIKMGLF